MDFPLDTLKRKFELLHTMEPKKLDDFAPLLLIKEQELTHIVHKRMQNELDQVGKYRNRIYYLSEKLQVPLFK